MKPMASGNSGQPSGTREPISSPNRARSSLSAVSNGTLAGTSRTSEEDMAQRQRIAIPNPASSSTNPATRFP